MPVKWWNAVVITLLMWRPAAAVDAESAAQRQEPLSSTLQQMVDTIIDENVPIYYVGGSATTTIKGSGDPSNDRAFGFFTNGVTAPGTLLPPENQNAAGNATYAGGIGVSGGICLCTGLITDDDPDVPPLTVDPGFGIGVQGPNNGQPLNTEGVAGEVDFDLETPEDEDFVAEVAEGSNATVLNFNLELESPGILRITYVHATDEHPQYNLGDFNDTFLVFIRNVNCPPSESKERLKNNVRFWPKAILTVA